MATYFAPLAEGLGDAIVSLPLLFALIEEGETFFVARCPRQEGLTKAIKGLAGTIREIDLKNQLRNGDRYINIRDHKIQKDYVWGSTEFAENYKGFRVNDILAVLARDFGIKAEFDKPHPLIFNRRKEAAGKIVLIPGTMTAAKTWSTQNWITLSGTLAEKGLDMLLVGQPEHSEVVKELISSGLNWIPTPNLQDAIDIVSSASIVVSVDTGLMHIAVQQGIPTVSLFQGYAVYYRPYPACIPIFSPMCAEPCLEFQASLRPNASIEFRTWSWSGKCSEDCKVSEKNRCTNLISPAQVLDKVLTCRSAVVS
jgi:ADP-heptose:LPS heptosyltransferase